MWKFGLFFIAAAAFANPAVEDVQHRIRHDSQQTTITQQKLHLNAGGVEEVVKPTVKCEEIIPDVGTPGPDNHQACNSHCILLGEYSRGRCLNQICHCTLLPHKNTKNTGRQSISDETHATVRCEHIFPSTAAAAAAAANHEACRTHCLSLDTNLVRGECVEGVCRCGIPKSETSPPRTSSSIHRTRTGLPEARPLPIPVQSAHLEESRMENVVRHPTVKCEHLVPARGAPSADNHEICNAHCHSLGETSNEYANGECVQGVCHCQRQRKPGGHITEGKVLGAEESGYPTVRCEHIHPESGVAGPENHEACSSHCKTVADVYVEGKCVVGMCRCRKGIVVRPVSVHPQHSPEEVIVQE